MTDNDYTGTFDCPVYTLTSIGSHYIDDQLLADLENQRKQQSMLNGWTNQVNHIHSKPFVKRVDVQTRNRLRCTKRIKQSIRGYVRMIKQLKTT